VLPEKNLRSDIPILLGLVPGFADNTAIVKTQDAFLAVISRDGGYSGGDSGQGGSRLKIKV
jgi:hypothetical protein